ncbi:hypothetical protein [Microvirga terricola]|uniref:Uncharacterized protein n=1 Tax=Microvirga terricola TaxID=2719797 RepID=A0ABX0VCI3_9HYPH|nr:hypothetical protein [Microvirga terricola]NIX76864.1 hypothetical protein [Microvirga terricola]
MIVALFTLSLAMIVGGLLSVFLGWDIVLIERGWTMVIAGAVTAASGAVLLGVTAAVSKLSKIQSELARLHSGLNEVPAEPAAVVPAAGLSLAALAGGLFGGGLLKGRADKAEKTEERPLPFFGTDKHGQGDEVALASEGLEETRLPEETPFGSKVSLEEEAAEVAPPAEDEFAPAKVPEFLFAERYRETSYTETRVTEVDDGLYVSQKTVETFTSEPEEKAEAAPEAAESAPKATVIGTYNSGDNKYVMYSDGSIEAETPQGMFTFKSLDELKEFIASGGEGPASAT